MTDAEKAVNRARRLRAAEVQQLAEIVCAHPKGRTDTFNVAWAMVPSIIPSGMVDEVIAKVEELS